MGSRFEEERGPAFPGAAELLSMPTIPLWSTPPIVRGLLRSLPRPAASLLWRTYREREQNPDAYLVTKWLDARAVVDALGAPALGGSDATADCVRWERERQRKRVQHAEHELRAAKFWTGDTCSHSVTDTVPEWNGEPEPRCVMCAMEPARAERGGM